MKRGQSAIEFVVLVSFMIAVFFVFFVVIQGRIVDLAHKQDLIILEEANNIVVSEVDLALAAAPDFEHSFVISDKGTAGFTTNISNNREVVSRFANKEYVNFFPFNVTGHLNAINKNNTIYRVDGNILFPDGLKTVIPAYAGIFMNVNPETCYIANNTDVCTNTLFSIDVNMIPFCQIYFPSMC